jgi:hypothetical protein
LRSAWELTVVGRLELGGWHVVEFAVEAPVVEPLDVGEGGELDVLDVAPTALAGG